MSFLALLVIVAPVFLIIVAGYVVRRAEWLTAEADASLLRLVVNLLFPCLILETILGNPALSNMGNLLLAPAIGFGTVLLGFAVAWIAAPAFGVRDAKARRTFAFTTGLYNYGYIALPLAQKLFDEKTTAVLFIHNVGVETAIWTVGLMLISGRSPQHAARNIFNIPLLAIGCAIALHFVGGRTWMPAWCLHAVHMIGAAAIPMGLILTGATFCDHAREVSLRGAVADSLGACVLRLGVLPALMIAAAAWLPLPPELRNVLLIQAAMPSAVMPVILAKLYGGDPRLALRIILCTSLGALVTIPWWIQHGLRWIGAGR